MAIINNEEVESKKTEDGDISPEVREHHPNEIGNLRKYCSSNYLLAVIILPVLVALLYYQLYAPIKQLNESIQQLNTSINMLNQQLSQQNDSVYQQLNEKVQQLNTSINVLNQQLSQQNDSVYQQLNEVVQQLNTSINMLDHQLSQQNDSVYQQLNEKVQQLNISLNQQLSQQIQQLNEKVQQVNKNVNMINQQLSASRSCGKDMATGGWRRVAELDMTKSSHQCPSGLMEHTYSSGKRICRMKSDSPSCSSVTYPMDDLGYSKVCGRIRGYQIGSTDAFAFSTSRPNTNINDYYVDGVSLTHGNSRLHIWTFASAMHEINSEPVSRCSCQVGSRTKPPAFVGNDYFCDTGSAGQFEFGTFYGGNPLWDGAGCGSSNRCCTFNNPPWFYKELSRSTSNNIEMRVCRDQARSDEDVVIDKIDIYVQ